MDAAIKEVNAILGEPGTSSVAAGVSARNTATTVQKPLLSVEKRCVFSIASPTYIESA